MIVNEFLDLLKRCFLSISFISILFYVSSNYTITQINFLNFINSLNIKENSIHVFERIDDSIYEIYYEIKDGDLKLTSENIDFDYYLTKMSENLDELIDDIKYF